MRQTIPTMLLLALLALLGACSREKKGHVFRPSPGIDADLAYSLVEQITAFGPHGSGTPGAEKVATFIRTKAEEFGAKTVIDEWTELTSKGNIVFRNVIAEIPGASRDFAIVGGHYDSKILETVPDFAGANDGGSSTGLQLAMIRAICAHSEKPPISLRFLFFDGEECQIQYSEHDGLHGSRRYARHIEETGELDRCLAYINLDMIGDRDLTITIPSDTHPPLANRLFEISDRMGVRSHLNWFKTGILDDHVPFQKRGIPAINIIDFEFGQGNRYWHTREDTMDKISPDSLRIVGNMTLQLIWNLP
jgi:glutaminyl-peptide cyclotransferase